MTVDTIASVEPDPEYSRCLTLTGPDSGKEFTDFSRVALTITTKQGQVVKLQIDRCRATSATTMHHHHAPPPCTTTMHMPPGRPHCPCPCCPHCPCPYCPCAPLPCRCGDAGGSGNSVAIVSKDGEEVGIYICHGIQPRCTPHGIRHGIRHGRAGGGNAPQAPDPDPDPGPDPGPDPCL